MDFGGAAREIGVKDIGGETYLYVTKTFLVPLKEFSHFLVLTEEEEEWTVKHEKTISLLGKTLFKFTYRTKQKEVSGLKEIVFHFHGYPKTFNVIQVTDEELESLMVGLKEVLNIKEAKLA